MTSNISTFRAGLKRTAASRFDLFAPIAFQGTAGDTYLLRVEEGLLTGERVELLDGTMGCVLTEKGAALARQMKS
jgi:hypothetical protein